MSDRSGSDKTCQDDAAVGTALEYSNAKLIVRAVNSHQALVEALSYLIDSAELLAVDTNRNQCDDAIDQARNALKLAKA